MSSTFLYREEIQYIEKSVLGTEGLLNYNYHDALSRIEKEHQIKKNYSDKADLIAVDLPGAYSMSPFTAEIIAQGIITVPEPKYWKRIYKSNK